MDTNALISSTLVLVGGISGYLLKYSLDKKAELVSEANKIKRENYKKFIGFTVDLIHEVKLKNIQGKLPKTINELKEDTVEYTKKVDDFHKDYLLYASPCGLHAVSF